MDFCQFHFYSISTSPNFIDFKKLKTSLVLRNFGMPIEKVSKITFPLFKLFHFVKSLFKKNLRVLKIKVQLKIS